MDDILALTDMNILLIALILYIIGIFISLKFNISWLLIATSVLWFVPIFLVDNIFVVVFSIIMIVGTFVITFFNERSDW